ncbi:site-2 protease family protein [Nostoc sp. UIC 10630]|uniref:site-2 protease family protein n=1 Tax=Nostoc sp. UIC 10630 TaxID=2100146 RepID=UPI0013D5FAFA|nr:site-2 protease family protein [Nostoc sp. UIC 10630]NEU83831.1 tetratricopeptide repeat protein [Nostoc sp. UIC 10630]
MQYLIYPIAIYVLLTVIRYLILFLLLRKSQIQYPKYQITKADTVPIYLKDLFQTPIKELKQFGFLPCSYLQYQPITKAYEQTNWELLLYHKALKSYATVVIRRLAEPVNLFDIEFYTFFKDRTLLLTVNGKQHGLIGEFPNTIVQDVYTSKVSVQWQTHQDCLKQLTTSKTACGLSPESFAQALQIQMSGYVSNLAKTGKISPIKGTESFQIYWLTVLRSLNPMTQGNKKAANIIKQRRQQAKTDASILKEIPIELEVEGFKQMQYTETGLVGKKFRTWLLLGSLGLFIASYTSFLTPQSVVIFIAVLFFHEGGHLLAMKLFGYRDTSVLFVPFLGALATAHKDDATLSQKFWISLAGPLPGLILGIGLAIVAPLGSGYPDWVRETSWTLIFLNLFNLLPVYPLDGGQIADLLLFSRFPYIGVLFKVFGVIILGFLGKDRPMMFLFAMLIAMGIPNSFRSAKINQKFQKELRLNPPIYQDNILHFIFKYLKQLGYGNLPFSKRYALVKGLIQQQHESRSKWKTRVFLLVIYCVTLLGGMVGTLQAIAPNWVKLLTYYQNSQQRLEQIKKNRQQEIELTTAALRTNPNDVNAYIKRSQARMGLHDDKGALADYDQIVRLKPHDIESRMTRASFRNRLKDYKGAIQDYNEILRLKPKNVSGIYYQRAQVLNHLEDYKGAIADYNEIIKLNAKDTYAYISRGYTRQKLQDYKGAIADANYVIQLNPKEAEAYILRSQIRRQLGDNQGAIADEQTGNTLFEAMDKEDPS